MSEQKSSVPKFGSFRPKPNPLPVSNHIPTSAPDITKPRVKRREQADDDQRRTHDRKHRSHSRDRRPDKTPKDQHPSPPLPQDSLPDVFVVDRIGDIKNLTYGIHRYSIPPYHRFGAGHVMGAVPSLKIDRDISDEKKVVLNNRRGINLKFREKYIFSKVERVRPRLLQIKPVLKDTSIEIKRDFLPFTNESSRKRRKSNHDENSDSEDDELNYRSIHGKAKASDQPEDKSLQYATESESSGSEAGVLKLNASIKQKTLELSRTVERQPHNIDAWIALIEHQDTLLRAGDEQRRITNAEMQSTADIKIHMYEKALSKATVLSDRERLLQGLMNEGSKIWEVKAQSARWEQIAKENIDSLVLWKSYLNFKQTTFSVFRYEETRDVFVKRIKLLLKAIVSTKADDVDSLFEQLLYVLLRLTIYMRESGYSELAVAIWQGLLEFNFFCPRSLINEKEKLARFNDFWDSEVPRIGENTALGWFHFVEEEGSSEAPDPSVDQAKDSIDTNGIFKQWACAERRRSENSRQPARTMDEVAEDDPFRVILASDIEEFLISLPTEALKLSLLDAFLLFCGLPPIYSNISWSTDCFIKSELLLEGTTWLLNGSKAEAIDPHNSALVDITSIFESRTSNFASSHDSMFNHDWFQTFNRWHEYYAGDNGPVPYSWMRSVLKQLTQQFSSQDLAKYHLAFEWRNEPASIKKIAKSLLKRHPSCLALYNAYAMIEGGNGNTAIANGVYSAALKMSTAEDSISLWRSWVWASIEGQDNITALRRLLSIVDRDPEAEPALSPALLLRTKQHLSSNRDYLVTSGNAAHAILYAECLAILEYLSSTADAEMQIGKQGNIAAALAVFKSFSEVLTGRQLHDIAKSHELFLQSAARLLYHHAKIGPIRPALLREQLTSFLKLFPRNTIFLALYEFNESRTKIDNRVRNLLLTSTLTVKFDTLTSRLFAIQYELNHGTIHAVRSAFESAMSSPVSKSSAGLWRFYVVYCVHNFPQHAKDVWYRALRACPWAKEVYTIGFENMEGLLDFGELKGTWKVMGEKELRVHVDLEDQFGEIGNTQDQEVLAEKKVRKLGFK